MDGLLVVLMIIIWIAVNSKKKKARQPKMQNNKTNTAATRRAERMMQLKQAQRTFEEAKVQNVPMVGEGESETFAAQQTMFRGSLKAESTEGECLCDPVLEHEREETIAPDSVYANEIGNETILDFSSKRIVQGVVMSEILKRPALNTRRMH